MSAAKAGLGVLVAVLLGGLVASVALAAQLGAPIADVTPWSIGVYALRYGLTPEVWRASAFGGVALAAGAGLWLFRTPNVDLGRARFATGAEIARAGLFARSGILLGRLGNRYLRSNDPVHVLVAAPTRSGKGVGVVIPNLLSWSGSAVVLDIKYENHALTSGFRAAHGQRVFRFSPADSEGRSHRYNPLDAVRPDPAHRVSDLQRLAAILLPAPAGMRDSFWQDEARSLFLGLALWALDTDEEPATLGGIFRRLMAPEPLDVFCRDLLAMREDLDPACVAALGSFMNKAEKERSGVRSTLTAALQLFANPVIDAATAASDFDLSRLRKEPTTIYVAVSLDQLPAVARLLSLFFQQTISLLAQRLPGEDEPVPVLLVLDELASLGPMPVLKDSLAFLAGYGVRVVSVVQGLGQLDDLYGRAGRESMLQNSALQLFFAANDELTARYVSERLGTKTIGTVSRSVPRGLGQGGGRSGTVSYGHAGRALMLPEEVRQLGVEEAVLIQEGLRPVRARKIRYYLERGVDGRVLPAAEVAPLVVLPNRASVRFSRFQDRSDEYGMGSGEASGREPGGPWSRELVQLEEELESVLSERLDL